MRILFITHDGLTDPIGQSQITPYLIGLARQGFTIAVVSAEKAKRFRLRQEVNDQLVAAGIDWHYVTYHNWPPLVSTAFDLCRIYLIASNAINHIDTHLLHCRSFLPMSIGLLLKRRFGVRLIFDFRDFWADRRLHSNRFKFVYRFFKQREGEMIRSSDHVVTLTWKARSILGATYLQGGKELWDERFTVIPTCVDVDLFDASAISPIQRRSIRERLEIPTGCLVFGYLGTVLDDYIPLEMFRAFRVLRSLEPKAMFLFVSPTAKKDILRYAQISGLDESDIRIISARRAEVPGYLAVFDLSVVFVRPDRTTAGVSPTKLAELFSCNIPVLASAGVGDMDEIVDPEINDSVLVREFTDAALERALVQLLAIVRSSERRGRAASMHFSLAEGIRRYRSVYERFAPLERPSC